MAMTDLLLEYVADWVSAAPWLTTIWVAAVGACVGSFLNVVIYRLPAGVSLIYPGSRCPHCGHAIRGYDNVPVLSWCLLRGRCRDCRGSIAVRYPLVEATVALLFAFQWWVDLQLGSGAPSDPTILATRIFVFLLHVSLFCCLLAGALIDLDGQSAPWSVAWPVLALVSLCAWQQPQGSLCCSSPISAPLAFCWGRPWRGAWLPEWSHRCVTDPGRGGTRVPRRRCWESQPAWSWVAWSPA